MGEGRDGAAWLAEWLDYTAAFPRGELRPAPAAKIERLRALARVDLPPAYEAYLRRMGESAGHTLRRFRAHLDIDEAIEIAEEDSARPEGHLVVGSGILDVYGDICLDLASGPDPRVVNADGRELLYPLADRFTGLLLQQAFLELELAATAVQRKLGVPHGTLDLGDVRHALSRLGFSYRGFSDAQNLCGALGPLRVGAFQLPGGFGWITLGGEPGPMLDEAVATLASDLGLRPDRRKKD